VLIRWRKVFGRGEALGKVWWNSDVAFVSPGCGHWSGYPPGVSVPRFTVIRTGGRGCVNPWELRDQLCHVRYAATRQRAMEWAERLLAHERAREEAARAD
jgi:hypothetical protein